MFLQQSGTKDLNPTMPAVWPGILIHKESIEVFTCQLQSFVELRVRKLLRGSISRSPKERNA